MDSCFILSGDDFDDRSLSIGFTSSVQRNILLNNPLDDSEVELDEGYLILLEVDRQNTDPLDLSRLQILNNIILVVIEDNDGKSCIIMMTHTHT